MNNVYENDRVVKIAMHELSPLIWPSDCYM